MHPGTGKSDVFCMAMVLDTPELLDLFTGTIE
jgi:hypothetical protein